MVQGDWVFVNVSVSDADYCSAFIDFNHSLVGYWGLDGDATDSGPNGLKGVLNGGLDCSVQGRFGRACSFDGVDDYINLSANTLLTFPGQKAFSIELWFKPNQPADWSVLLGKYNRYIVGEYLVRINSTGFVRVSREVNPYGFYSSFPVSFGEWHHLASVYDGGSQLLYLDGELAGSLGMGGVSGDRGSPVLVGAWLNRSVVGDFFSGLIDEVRIWNRSLSAQEVNASFNAGTYRLFRNFTGLPRGSVSFQAVAVDASGNLNSTEVRNVYVNKTLKPVADAGASQLILVGNPVVLNASRSRDPDGVITVYQWDFDNDGNFDYSGSDVVVTHDFGAEGNYSPTLVVVDNEGLNSSSSALILVRSARQPQVRNVVNNLGLYGGGVPKYEKFELTFDMDTIAANYFWPFDENPTPINSVPVGFGVSIDGLFLPPGETDWSKALVQPSFYYQDYIRANNSPPWDWLYPNGNPVWKIRFTPSLIGEWKYKIRVKDAGGEFETGESSFNCVQSNNRGFARVSSEDTRYFETDDGTYLSLIGLNDYTTDSYVMDQRYPMLKKMGVNFLRTWWNACQGPMLWGMSNSGGQVRDWHAETSSSGWAEVTYSYAEARPGELYSLRISGSDVARSSKKYGGVCTGAQVKPNTRYKFTSWVKGVGLEGEGDWGAYLAGSSCIECSFNKNLSLKQTQLDKWTKISSTITSSANAYSVGLCTRLGNSTAGNLYVAEISLKEDLGNGNYGPELASTPTFNIYKYVPQGEAWEADYLVESAKNNSIYLKVQLSNHEDKAWGSIGPNGRGAQQNGNYVYGNDNWASRTFMKYYWRYIIGRYGYATSIHSFEFLNEGDPYNGNHYNGAKRMAEFFTANDPSKHMVSTSDWHSFPPGLWRDSRMSFADLHMGMGWFGALNSSGCRLIPGWDGNWVDTGYCVQLGDLGTGYEIDRSTAHTGSNSLRITVPSKASYSDADRKWSKLFFMTGAKPGHRYRLSAWVKANELQCYPGRGGPGVDRYLTDGEGGWVGWPNSTISAPCGNSTHPQLGTYNWKFVSAEFPIPGDSGVAIASDGSVFIPNWWGVKKYYSNGSFILSFSCFGGNRGVAINSTDFVFSATPVSHIITRCNSTGGWVSNVGGLGTGDGKFNFPQGIAIDSNNFVYVADSGNHRVQKFYPNMTFLGWWGKDSNGSIGWHKPSSLVVSVSGSEEGAFNWPIGIAVDSANGFVYVADSNNNRIQKFSLNGDFVSSWGTGGTGAFKFLEGLAVDSSGNVYAADAGNNRIQKFSSSGNFLGWLGRDSDGSNGWHSPGSGKAPAHGTLSGDFNWPTGIAVDSNGFIYVADTGNSRSQKLHSNGTPLVVYSQGGPAWLLGVNFVHAGHPGSSDAFVWFDDFKVEDVFTGETLNFNGGFEYIEPENYDIVAGHQAVSKLTRSYGFMKPTTRGETGLWYPRRVCEFQNGTPRADWSWCYYKGYSTDGDQLLIDDSQGIWWRKYVWSHFDSNALIEMMWASRDVLFNPNLGGKYPLYGAAFQSFFSNIPLSNGLYEDAEASSSNLDIRVLGQKDLVNKKAHLWIDNRRHTWKNVVDGVSVPLASGTILLSGFGNDSYRLEWWNTTTGLVEQTEKRNASNGTISFSINNLFSDVALKIYLDSPELPPINASCGDGNCSLSENCSSCPRDCGSCSVNPPCTSCGGGGGGGPPGGGGVVSQTTSTTLGTTSTLPASTTVECIVGESKCVESNAGNFLFECVGGVWKTQKECRAGCTKLGVGGECRRESNETLANAYSRALAEVNSLLADAKAAGLNISAEELDLRKASEFKDRGDYSNAVEKLYSAKKALQEKLAGNAPTQGTLDVEAQRTIG
ncbi:PKD domain-containing protein, partial [Candidatus Micrarchaeota archaeon]|nr:PKD domain-containing protein [Candidatus Micrarchaeota archaeon]